MAINQVTLAELTNEVKALYAQLKYLLELRVATWANDVITIGTAGLQLAPYSLSSADATALFNAAQDLLRLSSVWQGLWYVASGATLNAGVPTANDATHFGYDFRINPKAVAGLGY